MRIGGRGLCLVSMFALASIGAGCSSPASNDSLSGASTGGSLEVYFPTAYSAFDGTHTFKLPAMVSGVSGVKWSASDPSLVDLAPSADGSQVMITMKGAGKVTITAKAGSLSGSEELTIRKADPGEYDNGKARYNDGVQIQQGGFRHPDPTLACTNCHAAGGMDVEHTPEQTGGYSDQDLINIMTTGTKPPGVAQRVMPFDRWHKIHQWQMSDAEKTGLVTYLRALEPESQGPVDFGGRGPHRDGGAPPPMGGGADAGSATDAGH